MDFSQNFLNNLLDSAVEYKNIDIDKKNIPTFFNNKAEAINIFSNALKIEANNAMQREIISDGIPILHAVNLDTNRPGIVTGESTENKKLLIHRKKPNKKIPKEKTQEQIEKEVQRIKEREQKKKLNQEKKKDDKEENVLAKHQKKVAKEMEREAKKAEKYAKNLSNKTKKEKSAILSQKNLSDNEKQERIKEVETEEELCKNNLKEKKESAESALNEFNTTNKNIEEKKENKKIELAEKKKIQEKRKIEREFKKEERRKKIELKQEEDKINIYDDLFDMVTEYCSENYESEDIDELDSNNIKIYESPLPFQRHINSLDMSYPNDLILPAVLKGEETQKGSFIKLFHGPPGTGKTYRLMKELEKLLKNEKYGRILVCAPSNIATCNLYNRAKKNGIIGSLVISTQKMPKNMLNKNNSESTTDRVVFSTVSMRFGRILREQKFTTIIMDEAAQCQEAWTWGLLRNEVKYLILAGDPNQLPALVSNIGMKLNHNRSLMERLISMNYPVQLLNVQHRMHPKIVDFCNINFYNNLLKTDYSTDINIDPIKIINVSSNEERLGTSYHNIIEAEEVINVYKKLKKKLKQVIIISPYKAQCKALYNLNNSLEIHTIDSFQGREAEGVIITTVRSGDNMGFWDNYKRLNVGMTRAKHALRIVGNVSSWEKSKSPLNKLAKYGKENNIIKDINTIKDKENNHVV